MDEAAVAAAAAAAAAKEAKDALPPLREAGQDAVEIEWWDEAFLTKEMRDDKVGAPAVCAPCAPPPRVPPRCVYVSVECSHVQG